MKNEKAEYVRKMDIRLNEWISRIDLVKSEAEQLEKIKGDEPGEQIKELYRKGKELRKLLKELKMADEDSWQDHKLGFESALEDLRKSVQEAYIEMDK